MSIVDLPTAGEDKAVPRHVAEGKPLLLPFKGKKPQRRLHHDGLYSEIRRIVIKHSKKAGLPHIKIHGFRHSCVSHLLSQGMSYRTVARWVGDTEEVVLQTYSHLIPDEKDQIGKFLNLD